MTTLRLIIVSDTHLSPATPEARANWEAVLEHVAAAAPDLVIHAGDLTLDGAHAPDELSYARRQLDRLPVMWRAVPGNHDIGDNPRPGQLDGEAITEERRARWLDTIDADWWAVELGPWTIVAIDAQLLGSGLAAEREQQDWLERRVDAIGDRGRVVLVSHKPVAGPADELAAAPPYRFVPPASRAWIAERLEEWRAPMVISGHVHQHRVLELDRVVHAWAPTTWAVLPDEVQPTFGTKRGGVLSVELHASGRAQASLVEPTGFKQLMLLRDVANPYVH